MVFPVVMYGCESWTIKKPEHWRIDVLSCGVGEDSWESLGLQGDQTSNPKGKQSWIFIGRTDAEALILWLPDAKSWLTGKDPVSGKDWKQEKKATEDEMVGLHHQLNRHKFEQALADIKGKGSLVRCSSWGHKQLDTTYRDWTTTAKELLTKLPSIFSNIFAYL